MQWLHSWLASGVFFIWCKRQKMKSKRQCSRPDRFSLVPQRQGGQIVGLFTKSIFFQITEVAQIVWLRFLTVKLLHNCRQKDQLVNILGDFSQTHSVTLLKDKRFIAAFASICSAAVAPRTWKEVFFFFENTTSSYPGGNRCHDP
jgi:hypothetical protein